MIKHRSRITKPNVGLPPSPITTAWSGRCFPWPRIDALPCSDITPLVRLNDDFQLMFLVDLRKRAAISDEQLRFALGQRLAELLTELKPTRRRRLRRAHGLGHSKLSQS